MPDYGPKGCGFKTRHWHLLFSGGFPFNVELKYTRSQCLGQLGWVVERFAPLALELKIVSSRPCQTVTGDGGGGTAGFVRELLAPVS